MTTSVLIALGLLTGGCGAEGDPPSRAAAPTAVAPSASAIPADAPTTTHTPTTTPTPTAPPRPRVIPRGFPLAHGYPADEAAEPGRSLGLKGPHRAETPIEITACGRPVVLPEPTDLLRAGWRNVEDYRDRQLATFASPREASSYVEAVTSAHRACPRDPDELTVALTDVVETDLGDQGIVLSRRFESHDGWSAVGLVTTHVVRVGSAVLLASTSNEGGAGPDPEAQAAEQIEVDAEAIAGVVDAMADL